MLWAGVILGLLALPAGCSLPPPERGAASASPVGTICTYPQYGCTLVLPEGWLVVSEKERQGVLTVRARDEAKHSSYLIATVFPAGLYNPEEAITQGERLLKSSLYALQGPVRREEIALGAGTAPLLAAEAGEKNRVEARTAVLRGKQAGALVTVMARQESFPAIEGQYRVILKNIELK